MFLNSKRIKNLFLSLALLFCGGIGLAKVEANPLREHLSTFFEFHALDSVLAMEQKSPTSLQVTVVDGATNETRTLVEEVGTKPMQKLLSEANDLGLKTIPLVSKKSTAASENSDPATEKVEPGSEKMEPSPPVAGKKPGVGRSVSSQRKNRMWYIATQSALSTYVYGISIPLALEVKSTRVAVATPMIVAPFAFGAHFWFAKNRPFEDSHSQGVSYLSLATLYASYALPFAALEQSSDPFRVASFLTIGTYPLGIWAGYMLGDKYLDLPGRIDTQEKFAIGFGIMGFFSPFLYYSDMEKHAEPVFRLALGQSVAMAAMGHFLADHYRSGQNIPGGVNTGIMDHTVLGMSLGVEVAALADASHVRPWIGAALFGGTLGFMEGLFYYRNSYDSQERGLYNTLGGLAGTLLGGGFVYLLDDNTASPYARKVYLASFLVGGTLLGYVATNFLTEGMEDRTGLKQNPAWLDKVAFNPIPVPEVQFRGEELYVRYHIPGISYRF